MLFDRVKLQVAILTYNGAEVFLIITKVESSLMSNLSVDWDIGGIATFLEGETSSFFKSSCFHFCPFVVPFTYSRVVNLCFITSIWFCLFFYPQFQTTFVSDFKRVS